MVLGKYYNLALNKNYYKICYIVDIFNGEDLSKNHEYKLDHGEGFISIHNNFYFKDISADIKEFLNLCFKLVR